MSVLGAVVLHCFEILVYVKMWSVFFVINSFLIYLLRQWYCLDISTVRQLEIGLIFFLHRNNLTCLVVGSLNYWRWTHTFSPRVRLVFSLLVFITPFWHEVIFF